MLLSSIYNVDLKLPCYIWVENLHYNSYWPKCWRRGHPCRTVLTPSSVTFWHQLMSSLSRNLQSWRRNASSPPKWSHKFHYFNDIIWFDFISTTCKRITVKHFSFCQCSQWLKSRLYLHVVLSGMRGLLAGRCKWGLAVGSKKVPNFHNKIPCFSPKKGSGDKAWKESLILELESTTDKLTHNVKDLTF